MLIIDHCPVTVKCRTQIKELFLTLICVLSWIVNHVHLHPYPFLHSDDNTSHDPLGGAS